MSGVSEPPHLVGDLRELKLPSIVAQWERLAEQARRKRTTHAAYLAELVRQEVIDREERRIKRRIREARLPVLKTLDAFDFGAGHGLDRDDVLELFECRFAFPLVAHESAKNSFQIGAKAALLRIGPIDPRFFILAARTLEGRKRFGEAEQQYRKALKIDADKTAALLCDVKWVRWVR